MSEATESQSPWIVDTDEESFERDVIERSKEVPVVVDFWADNCPPCRMLAPILEQIAKDYDGKFTLVKANLERNMKAAGEFNVQVVPTVYAISNGDPVDFFQGLLPEEQLRQWIDGILVSGEAVEALRLEDADPSAAEAKYRAVLEQTPDNSSASIGLARVLVAQERTDEAQEVIDQLEKRGFLEPEGEKVKASLQLRGMQGVDVDQARATAEAAPDDLDLQLKLAEALAAKEQFQEAMDVCLGIVQKDKTGVGDQARQVMVDIFRVLSDEDLVREYRRKLSTLLY